MTKYGHFSELNKIRLSWQSKVEPMPLLRALVGEPKLILYLYYFFFFVIPFGMIACALKDWNCLDSALSIGNYWLTLYHSDTYFPVSMDYHSDTYFTVSIHYHLDPYIPVYRPFEQIRIFPCLKINRVIFTFFLKTETPDVYRW